MENILAARIRAMRKGGVVIEMWMVKEDAKAMTYTCTWMPISHMTTCPFPRDTQNAPEDMTVSLQHCKEYIYAERYSRDKVLAAVEIIWDEETRLRAEEERVALMEQALLDAELAETQPFVDLFDGIKS